MINIKDINVGDDVTIKAKVAKIESDFLMFETASAARWGAGVDEIATHTPKPLEPRIGGVVRFPVGHFPTGECKIVGMDGHELWLKNKDNLRFTVSANKCEVVK